MTAVPPPTTGPTPAAFDLCGELPTGTTVLEASAGTGKTHTIAGLAVRYVAEGVARIDELMLVTFGRAATAELRERVRSRLTAVTLELADVSAARDSSDDLVAHLATGPDAEVTERHRRLATAVADFDAATIATTHAFCHQMLAGLGIAADLDHDVTFAEATGDLVLDVATDLYVADYGREASPVPPEAFAFGTASRIAGNAVGDPAARLEPEDAEADTDARLRLGFAQRARTEVARRKRAMRVMDYDDLLVYLRDALTHPEIGEDACARIRNRYRIVLVDEFQDTDPVQWDILRATFHGHRTLVLIGDPKQAIYAFRGGDVVTYLLAKGASDSESTLGTNWRSDRPLVDGLRHLFGDVALGDESIVVHEVSAAHGEASLVGAPVTAPVRIRRVPRDEFGASTRAKVKVGDARPFVARDVACDIVDLLSSGAEVVERDGTRRPVEAADIAVLVHRNDDGAAVRDALAAANVPVVLTATTSVFLSDAARQWLDLLSALEQPQRTGLARNAALTDFLGWTVEELAAADDTSLDELAARLRSWTTTLSDRGVSALVEEVTSTGLPQRVLAREDGERDLTDLRHVGQALHQAANEGYHGVSSLVQWLQQRRAEAAGDHDEERSRRLDSDAKAVQVLTIWRSKGLEYPVVYTPFLWDRWVPGSPDPLQLHDEDKQRVLDVGGPTGPGYEDRKTVHLAEDAGESLRLAYVALTRARCQVVAHWLPGSSTATSPLHRLLFGDRARGHGAGSVVPDVVAIPDEKAARERFEALEAGSDGLVSVETVGPLSGACLAAPSSQYVDLSVRSFDRELDRAWRRTSYSGITAGLHEAALAHGTGGTAESEPEGPGTVDEPVLGALGALGEGGFETGLVPRPSSTTGETGLEARPSSTTGETGLEARPSSTTGETGLEARPSSTTGETGLVPRPSSTTGETGLEARPSSTTGELVSPMVALPLGAAFGTLVHAVLERADFTATDLVGELAAAAELEGSDRFVGVEPADLAAALAPSVETPLGGLAGGLRLGDIGRTDRLDEMSFELPLAGGETPTGEVRVSEIADLLRGHLAPDDPLVGYAGDLDVPLLAGRALRGFLTGSIDAVLRVRGDEGIPRYLVVDYKTNWLGEREHLTAHDYRPEALARAMRHAHYPLQALLYAVALHRYLRWRQPGYDPEVHLGGVLYLFLRGMCGPDTPAEAGTPYGVFSWKPPAGLVLDLSDLLHGPDLHGGGS